MENVYVTRLKGQIEGFAEMKMQANNKMKENTDTFQKDIAKAENGKLQSEIQNRYTALRAEIIKGFSEIRMALSYASVPFGDMPQEKVFFSEFPIDFTPDEFFTLSDLHKGDFTWQRFLLQKIAEAEKEGNGGLSEFVDVKRYIESRMPGAVLEAYRQIFESALSLIESISNGVVNKAIINSWMEEKRYTAGLYQTIGNGKNISDFLNLSDDLPERAAHYFDSIVLHQSDGREAIA